MAAASLKSFLTLHPTSCLSCLSFDLKSRTYLASSQGCGLNHFHQLGHTGGSPAGRRLKATSHAAPSTASTCSLVRHAFFCQRPVSPSEGFLLLWQQEPQKQSELVVGMGLGRREWDSSVSLSHIHRRLFSLMWLFPFISDVNSRRMGWRDQTRQRVFL